METAVMGRVLTEVTVENLKDLWELEKDVIANDKVRRIHVTDALVDTGATTLALPSRYIQELGLTRRGEKRSTSSRGTAMIKIYEAVRLTILGREMTIDPVEVPDDCPVLIGQIPLEMLDLVVDLQARRLTGNPAHGGEHTLEMY